MAIVETPESGNPAYVILKEFILKICYIQSSSMSPSSLCQVKSNIPMSL